MSLFHFPFGGLFLYGRSERYVCDAEANDNEGIPAEGWAERSEAPEDREGAEVMEWFGYFLIGFLCTLAGAGATFALMSWWLKDTFKW